MQGDRHSAVTPRIVDLHNFENVRRRGDGRKVDKFHPILGGQSSGDVFLGEDSGFDEGFEYVSVACVGAGVLELTAGDQADILENLNDVIFVMGHGVGRVSEEVRGKGPKSPRWLAGSMNFCRIAPLSCCW